MHGVGLQWQAHLLRSAARPRITARPPVPAVPTVMLRSNSQRPQPQIVHANCPHCHIPNQLVVPNSSDHFVFQCGSCSQPFRVQISLLPPARDVRLCRFCGCMNAYVLPGVGMPFPSISCGGCGRLSQAEGTVTERDRQRAEFLAQSMDGPSVVVTVRGMRWQLPLRFLQAPQMHARTEDCGCSSADIAALPVQKVDKATHLKEQTCCMICLENFKDGEELKTLPCMHMFHSDEIDSWLKQNNSCPICKTPVGLKTQGHFCGCSK